MDTGLKPAQGHPLSVCFATVHRLALRTLLEGLILHILPPTLPGSLPKFQPHLESLPEQVIGLEQQRQPLASL